MQLALQLLGDPAYDALLARPVPFESLPEALPGLFGRAGSTVTELIEYTPQTPVSA
jgi:hypothetical protein